MSNIINNKISSGKAIGGCYPDIIMYSSQFIGDVEYDEKGAAIIEVDSDPVVLACAPGSVSFEETWEEDEKQGGYYKVSISASISGINSITTPQMSLLSIHRWVVILRLSDGSEKVFGLTIPLQLSYNTAVTGDYKGNSYYLNMIGVSAQEAPFLSRVTEV